MEKDRIWSLCYLVHRHRIINLKIATKSRAGTRIAECENSRPVVAVRKTCSDLFSVAIDWVNCLEGAQNDFNE